MGPVPGQRLGVKTLHQHLRLGVPWASHCRLAAMQKALGQAAAPPLHSVSPSIWAPFRVS